MKRALPVLFAATMFASAFLLFVIQPMVARRVLPALGGTPAVWTSCVLFFQTALLASYASTRLVGARLGPSWELYVHMLFIAVVLASLPEVLPSGPTFFLTSTSLPALRLLAFLTGGVGLPVFFLGTTAPLLQRWFASIGHRSSADPYYLYAASNAGSLVALAAYPLWIERRLRLGQQWMAWRWGLWLLAFLIAACAVLTWMSRGRDGGANRAVKQADPPATGPHPSRAVLWVVLSLIPSSLMLGVTTHLTTDITPMPMLWVVPLALYLLTYILAFGRIGEARGGGVERVFPWLVLVMVVVLGVGLVQLIWVPFHLATFFAAALLCHRELAARRPLAAQLTSFYLAMALGGVLGGFFNALIAPLFFDRAVEYPLGLFAACLVWSWRVAGIPGPPFFAELRMPAAIGLLAAAVCADVGGIDSNLLGAVATTAAAGLTVLIVTTRLRRPWRFALTAGALLAASGLATGVTGLVLVRERDFFGILKVTSTQEGNVHRLFHGNTLHGQQDLSRGRRHEALAFFTRSGPIGDVFAAVRDRHGRGGVRVAVAGMGVGSLATYAEPSDDWTFFEINPAVVKIARNPFLFTHLSDCLADRLTVEVGDARLCLARAGENAYDLIVLDAFNSDAIPTHLMTREAVALYRRKLVRGGLIVLNISNRYLDLAPVVARLAADAAFVCRVRTDAVVSTVESLAGKQGSVWAVIAASEADLGGLARDPRWITPDPHAALPVWSDDFSSVVDHLRLFPEPGRR